MRMIKSLIAVVLVFAATANAKKINTTYNDEGRFWDGLVVGTTTARSASYVVDVVGNSRFTGTLTATTLSGATSLTVPGYVALTSATAITTISTSTVVPHVASYVVVVSSGGAVVSEANPQITAGVSGEILIIRGNSDTNTVGLVDGNGLALSAAATLGANDTLTLIYDTANAVWVEIARANN